MNSRASPGRFVAVLALLVFVHFAVRPWLGTRGTPDFMLLALMLYAIRAAPGRAAVAGFGVGLTADALAGAAFGSGAFAHTVVAYLQAWGKAVFFPDNLTVNLAFFFVGAWGRDFLVMLTSGQVDVMSMFWQMATWSLLQAVTTTGVGLVVLLVFRRSLIIGVGP